MSEPVTLHLTAEEREELLAALPEAITALVVNDPLCQNAMDRARRSGYRATLLRFYERLSRSERTWEDEQEIGLLRRAGIVLRIFAARLIGRERQNVEILARRLARAAAKREGIEEAPDGQGP